MKNITLFAFCAYIFSFVLGVQAKKLDNQEVKNMFQLIKKSQYKELETLLKKTPELAYAKEEKTGNSLFHALLADFSMNSQSTNFRQYQNVVRSLIHSDSDLWYVANKGQGKKLGMTPVQYMYEKFHYKKDSLATMQWIPQLDFEAYKTSFCHRGVLGFNNGFAFAKAKGVAIDKMAKDIFGDLKYTQIRDFLLAGECS